MNLPDHPQQNRILASLSAEAYERLANDLERVSFRQGQILHEPGDRGDHVYFPTTCLISRVIITENGSSIELAVTGNDGLLGIATVLGGETMAHRTEVQMAGHAYRMNTDVLRWELDQGGEFQFYALRYVRSLMAQMAQNVVCIRHHSLDQQLCRWLLLSLDIVPGNQLDITQERIANMLGVRREGVTEAARNLQAAGLIEYARGHITAINRPGLEARVCECYGALLTERHRQAGVAPGIRFKPQTRPNPSILRRRAEIRLRQAAPILARTTTIDGSRQLHELQVHQIELELQIEELGAAYAEADVLRKRYADIYDFSPVGYFTLDRGGMIIDLNLTGAIFLGITRSQMDNHRFVTSVIPECRTAFARFLEKGHRTPGKNICETSLSSSRHRPESMVRIEAVPDESGQECRMVVIDITTEKLAEQALLLREQYQRALLENFPFCVWLKDEQGRFLAANNRLASELGCPTSAALLGKTDFDFLPKPLAESFRAHDREVLGSGLSHYHEQRLDRDGRERWFEFFTSPIGINDQRIGIVGFARDITANRAAQQALAESERQQRSFMENLPLGAIITRHGILKYANPKAAELSGYSVAETVGESLLHMVLEADRERMIADHEGRMKGDAAPADFELRLLSKDGRVIDCLCHFSTVQWEKRTAILGIIEDVSEKNRVKAELKSLETIDLLTRLANRPHFAVHIGQSLSRMHRDTDHQVALLTIELDHFRQLSSRLGAVAGNSLLRLLSTLLSDELRNTDTGARIGDAEFAVLLPETSLVTAAVFAERLRKKAAALSAIIENRIVPISVNIGISTLSANDTSSDQVLLRASHMLDADRLNRHRSAARSDPPYAR